MIDELLHPNTDTTFHQPKNCIAADGLENIHLTFANK